MTRISIPIFALVAALFVSPVYAADAGSEVGSAVDVPIEEAVSTVVSEGKSVFAKFEGGRYREAIAGLITLLIFAWRRFARRFIIGKLSPWWVGFVTILLGFLGSLPAALSTEPFSIYRFVISGLITSAEAMLFWQVVGSKVLPKVFGDPPPMPNSKTEALSPSTDGAKSAWG